MSSCWVWDWEDDVTQAGLQRYLCMYEAVSLTSSVLLCCVLVVSRFCAFVDSSCCVCMCPSIFLCRLPSSFKCSTVDLFALIRDVSRPSKNIKELVYLTSSRYIVWVLSCPQTDLYVSFQTVDNLVIRPRPMFPTSEVSSCRSVFCLLRLHPGQAAYCCPVRRGGANACDGSTSRVWQSSVSIHVTSWSCHRMSEYNARCHQATLRCSIVWLPCSMLLL